MTAQLINPTPPTPMKMAKAFPNRITKPIPAKIAKPTPRTHEENQERAYVAASRRSDRSLEARMESAKRASEIHKKRTGRSYRITEEAVINEQMYEEEDDGPRYRLGSHMPMANTLLAQRAQSMVSIHMENQRVLSEAVNSTLHHNPQFQNQAQFISPGMTQMSQYGFQMPMASPQSWNQASPTLSNYAHSPYSASNDWASNNFHQRSASYATLQPNHSQSANNSPVESRSNDSRRMSLPPQKQRPCVPQSPQLQVPRKSSTISTPVASRNGSYPASPSAQQPMQQSRSQMHHDYSSYFDGSNSYPPPADPRQVIGTFGPLSTTLPMDTQQMLDGNLWPNMNTASYGLMGQTQSGVGQQPFYNYRPNGGNVKNEQPTSEGLNQTLLATAHQSKAESTSNKKPKDKPAPAHAPGHDYSFNFGDNSTMFNLDHFDTFDCFSSAGNSPPPSQTVADEWSSFLDNDMFNDMHAGATA